LVGPVARCVFFGWTWMVGARGANVAVIPGFLQMSAVGLRDTVQSLNRHGADVDRSEEWETLRRAHLQSPDRRSPSSGRGVHHIALLSSDVEQTIGFYQGLLEFPLTELFENRDYRGSTHFFFDIGNGNLLALDRKSTRL